MTLALYGKSRKRQGSLLLAALLAIVAASIGGLALISTAFAHNTAYTKSATCTGWTAKMVYANGGGEGANSSDRRLILIQDVQLNGTAYAPSWSNSAADPAPNDSGDGGTPAGTNGVVARGSYVGSTDGLPAASASDYLWVGNTGDFTIFDRTGATPLNANWGGAASVWKWSSDQSKWIDQNYTSTVTAPSAPTNCDGKIIIKKYVPDGQNTTTVFSADVQNTTENTQVADNATFSEAGSPGDRVITINNPGGDNFSVTENALAGYALTGVKVYKSSSIDCRYASYENAGAATITDLDGGETFTVCFRNEAVGFITISKGECADSNVPAWSFHFVAPNTNAGSGGNITVGYSIDGGATQYTSPLAENGNGAKANWHVSIPFGGGASITIISASTSTGISWDGVQGADNKTASGTACQPQVVNPSVKKVAHNPAISGGYALFDIIIDQPTTGAAAITGMKIVDAKSDIQLVDDGTATCTNASGTLTCDVTTADATIQVKRAINASTLSDGSICLGGHIQNWITSASLDDNTVLTVTEGGAGSKVTTTVPADNTACEGSQTIEKSDGVKDGNVIKWTITLHNSYPIAKTFNVYDSGASLVANSENGCTGTLAEGPEDYFVCEVGGNSSASFVLSTPAPVHSNVCQPLDLTNVAYIAASTTSGSSQNLGSDSGAYHEDASQSASCVTISKGDGVKDGNVIKWVVTLTNNSSVNQTVAVYDANSSFVTSTCLNTVSESPADTYSCTVPAKSQATITLSTAYSGSGGICTGYRTNNTAWITGNQNASDTAEYSDTAEPDKSCLTVVKEKSDTSEPPTWNIKITNTADTAMAVYLQDSDATLAQVVSGGSCAVGDTIMGNGVQCSVNANSTLILSVTKETPALTCEGTPVSNTVKVWVGKFDQTPSTTPDFTKDGGTFEGLGKDPKLCNRQVSVTKYYQYVDGTPFSGATAADRPTFTMTPNPWTGQGTYNIVDDANCDLQDNGSNIVWTCTIPASANPTVTETPAANWVESFNGQCQLSLVRDVSKLVANSLNVVVDEYVQSIGWFCNYPVGTIEIVKNDLTTAANTARPADWDFTATGPYSFSQNRSIALGGGSVLIANVPLGNGYAASEVNGSYDTCRTEGEAGIHQYFTTNISAGPTNLTQPGQKITFTFKNEDCGAVLGTGSLHIWKVRDINANGIQDGGDSNIVWTVTVTGPEFPGGQVFNVPVGGLHLNGITEGAYTITEGSQFGYVLVGVRTTENGSLVASTSTSVTVVDNQEDTVTFYNQPLGQIPVHKNAFTSHNGGPNVPAPNDDDGWTITLTSVDCGINQVQQTNANGDALFTNLPLCTDYVVKEGANNPLSPGFVPLTGDRFENITPNGVTLTFNNILRTQDCVVNCGGTTPTPTPTVPTATPTVPTNTATPTNTPVPPTNTVEPTKTAVVGGEKTPGPGQPTPIAPSTGGGMLGGTAGGFNLLLVIAGLLALTSGVSFLALGRKNRR